VPGGLHAGLCHVFPVHYVSFVLHNIPLFSAVIRKSIYSLWCNLKNCDNVVVQTFLLSDICMLSPLFKSWRTSIFSSIFSMFLYVLCLLYLYSWASSLLLN